MFLVIPLFCVMSIFYCLFIVYLHLSSCFTLLFFLPVKRL